MVDVDSCGRSETLSASVGNNTSSSISPKLEELNDDIRLILSEVDRKAFCSSPTNLKRDMEEIALKKTD